MGFQLNSWSVEWIIMALQTITPEHRELHQITIKTPHHTTRLGADLRRAVKETNCGQWLDVDRLLAQLSESRSIRPKVVYTVGQRMKDYVGRLLPEITKTGVIDLVER